MTQTPTHHDLRLALPVREAIGFRGSFELAQEAERLGYRSLWTAEVSGLDAFTVLAAYATVTTRVQLGTAVIAIQTRTPVMMAMSFASLHVLSGGRGEIADGVLFNYSPAEAIAPMIAEVRNSAEAAGRDPNAIDYAMYVRCCVTDDVSTAVQAYKRELSSYGFVEPYVRMFTRYGFGDDLQGFRRLWQAGKRDEAGQGISDKMAHTLAAIGPKEKGREYIQACRAAGLTHPILFPIGAPKNAPLELPRTMRELAEA